jgi:membrane-associated protease RseP (regulator of RpoE activity)
MQLDFERDLPYDIEHSLAGFATWWKDPSFLLHGLPFSLTLLTILLAHEFGHYLACMYYRVDASLPYFLPGPPVMGTFGAFIRMRSAIYSKRVLFDIAIAGPLAGFVFLLPALAVGLAFSKVIPGIGDDGSFRFGIPALQWVLQHLIFPGVDSRDLYLHPVARAAWIGIVATALNLLPIGQLDGGHILYSFVGARHRLISKLFAILLVPMAIFWPAWLLWAVILFFLGRRHPMIYDPSELGAGRARLGWVALMIFLLCFTLAPVSPRGL